ncbi:MAG: MerR family transcriptional regulator [Flavipsychrobacter sp.]|nr:MerR family transcriptional regulator [Flavipsychrobacter sp.]
MSVRVLTLFGEEIIPEQLNAVGRPAKAKKAKPTAEELTESGHEETGEISTPSAAEPAVQAFGDLSPAESTNSSTKPKKKVVLRRRATETEKEQETAPIETTGNILDGWNGEKQYYSIGEVAKLFKLNTSHIRFWTNEFELKVRTTRKGDRLYTPEQVREIRGIYHLVKEKKYTISGAKAKLKEKNVTVQSIDLKKSLLHLRNKLLTIRNQLS